MTWKINTIHNILIWAATKVQVDIYLNVKAECFCYLHKSKWAKAIKWRTSVKNNLHESTKISHILLDVTNDCKLIRIFTMERQFKNFIAMWRKKLAWEMHTISDKLNCSTISVGEWKLGIKCELHTNWHGN